MRVLVCPLSDRGYLYPAIAVARELRERGHEVHVLARATAAPGLALAGLPMLAAEDYGGQGAFSVSHWTDHVPRQYAAVSRAARELGADALLTSALCLGPLLAGEALDLPVTVLGFAVHLWNYGSGAQGEPDRPGGFAAGRAGITRAVLSHLDAARDAVGIPGRPGEEALHGTVTLLRGHPALEYPGAVLPARVRHAGPCLWEPPADPGWLREVTTRLERVGKPVVYVHLGRVFGGTDPWARLNATFTGGEFQAVVEQGRSADPRPSPDADILLLRAPWMAPLVERAAFVLSSGTSAPVLAALRHGRPLGLTPNGSEQPLLAQACLRAGVGALIPPDGHDPAARLCALHDDPELHANARNLAGHLSTADGVARAADAVEAVPSDAGGAVAV